MKTRTRGHAKTWKYKKKVTENQTRKERKRVKVQVNGGKIPRIKGNQKS